MTNNEDIASKVDPTTNQPSSSSSSSSVKDQRTISLKFCERKDHLRFFRSDLKLPSNNDGDDDDMNNEKEKKKKTKTKGKNSHLIKTSYQLLQLPEELLDQVKDRLSNKSAEDSSSVLFELRGREDDEVVLTTPNKTYSLRSIQNSNSVMICGFYEGEDEQVEKKTSEGGKPSLRVLKIVHESVQVEDITNYPGDRLNRIKEILTEKHSYQLDRSNSDQRRVKDDGGRMTLSSLSNQIRASDREILNYLNDNLCTIRWRDGSIKVMSPETLTELVIETFEVLKDLKIDPFDSEAEEFMIGEVVEILAVKRNIEKSVLIQVLNRFLVKKLPSLSQNREISFYQEDNNSKSFDDDDDDEYGYKDHRSSLKFGEMIDLVGLSILRTLKPTKVIINNNNNETSSSKSSSSKLIQTIPIKTFLRLWNSKLGIDCGEDVVGRIRSERIRGLKDHCIIFSNDQRSQKVQENFLYDFDDDDDLFEGKDEGEDRLEGLDLVYIPTDRLSTDPKLRISELFEIRSKWTLKEFQRFIRPLIISKSFEFSNKPEKEEDQRKEEIRFKKKFDELVLKYCRKIVINSNETKNSKNNQIVLLTARNKW